MAKKKAVSDTPSTDKAVSDIEAAAAKTAEEVPPDYALTALAGTDIRNLALRYTEILNTEAILKKQKEEIAEEVYLLTSALEVKSARIYDVPGGYKPLQVTRVDPTPPCAPGQTDRCRKPKLNLPKLMLSTGITAAQIEAASDPQEPTKGSIRITAIDGTPNVPAKAQE